MDTADTKRIMFNRCFRSGLDCLHEVCFLEFEN